MPETRKIIKNNRGSYYFNIPKEMMKELRWKDNQLILVKKRGKTIILSDK